MKNPFETEIKVGIFVSIGVALTALAIIMLGGTDGILTKQNSYFTHFKTVDGLVIGAKVALGGLPIGSVTHVTFEEKDGTIRVEMKVPRKYSAWIRKDTEVEVLTQGVLGDKYLSLNPGAPDTPPVADGSEITTRPTKDFAQVLSKSDKLIVSLNSIAASLDSILKSFDTESRGGMLFKNLSITARNLSQASQHLDDEVQELQLKKMSKGLSAIIEKVNNGTGTLGALINDPGLYDDAKALMGGANRNRIIRNLVRKTVKDGDEADAKASGGK